MGRALTVTVTVTVKGAVQEIPVSLHVFDFALPIPSDSTEKCRLRLVRPLYRRSGHYALQIPRRRARETASVTVNVADGT